MEAPVFFQTPTHRADSIRRRGDGCGVELIRVPGENTDTPGTHQIRSCKADKVTSQQGVKSADCGPSDGGRCSRSLVFVDSLFKTDRRSAAAMTPPPSSSSPTLLLVMVTSLMTSLVTSQALDPETCYSRQHQSAIVNVRQAMTNPSTAMDARAVTSERDCVLSCCSEEVKPGEVT
ncbi:hypothetical protein NQZ68_035753 [Dissostichus eleginoides]|nr:hypothetical protein NQZ68_035753 [Dissostichus eleginoides]